MIGIIGGTGFYALLEEAKEQEVSTPYGKPSSALSIGKIAGKDAVFISRHGKKHNYPPHKVPYKANIWALKELGVKQIITSAAVGSLKPEVKPGDFLIPDQFVNFTHGRDDTFYHGTDDNRSHKHNPDHIVHIGSADPFCNNLRDVLIKSTKKYGRVHEKGTVVVIQGPRFSSRAESQMFRLNNWDIINMTLYPECILARELEMCYANISLITDYDTGVANIPNEKPVSTEEVIKMFKQNNEKLNHIISTAVNNMPERTCNCKNALEGAKIN